MELIDNKKEETTSEDNFPFLVDSSEEDDIIGSFAKILNTSREDLIIHSRKQHLVRNRDIVMYILREFGEMSYPAIGKLMGGRDHTTVIHAYRKVRDKIKLDDNQGIDISRLIDEAKKIKENKDYIKNILTLQVAKSVTDLKEHKDYIKNVLIPQMARSIKEKIKLKPKEISKRNIEILELYREAITLANIGSIFGLTRERVRQVVGRTIQQLAFNESLQKGIELDVDVLIDEEKKKRMNKTQKEVVLVESKEKRWSRFHMFCKLCKSSALPHVRNGLCEKCIGQYRGSRRENIIQRHNNKCGFCDMSRTETIKNYSRDFYITKDQQVFCQKCFLKTTGETLGRYKNYEWSRHYPSCISCGTTSIAYVGSGLCKKCSIKLSSEDRESIIINHAEMCDICKIKRATAIEKWGHDLFITKEKQVFCVSCHLKNNRNKYLSE